MWIDVVIFHFLYALPSLLHEFARAKECGRTKEKLRGKEKADDEIVNKKKKTWGRKRANSGGDNSDPSGGSRGKKKESTWMEKRTFSPRRSKFGTAAKPSTKCICDIYIYIYIYVVYILHTGLISPTGPLQTPTFSMQRVRLPVRDCACDCMAVI